MYPQGSGITYKESFTNGGPTLLIIMELDLMI